jgi:hypothetical protein
VVGGRRDRRCRDRGRDLPVRPAAGRCFDAGRARRDGRRVGLRRLRRGRGLRARAVGGGVGPAGAAAVRRLRRRRVRGRADLRRDPRRLRREGGPRDLPRARGGRRRRRGRPPRRPRHRHRAPRPRLAGPPPRRPPRIRDSPGRNGCPGPRRDHHFVPDYPVAGVAEGRRRGAGRRAGAARGRPQRDADLRPRRRAPGRGDAGLRVGVRAEAAAAGVRCDRLRRGRGPGRGVPRLPRHRVRRPARLRHHQPVPGRRRGRR